MKFFNVLLIAATLYSITSCGSDDSANPDATGTASIEFDNAIGSSLVSLDAAGSTDYGFETQEGQTFNLTKLQYYISKIQLSGPNGEYFEDELNVSANANEIRGYYMIQEDESTSKILELEGVPYGKYNQITFTIGIDEAGVQEGAAGGILDPADGAPFWNWNAGYIAMTIEGQTSALDNASPEFEIHIGGWKDIAPADGETQKFYNNVKTITLDFGVEVSVSESFAPEIHIVTDIQKILGEIDFTTTSAVHSPAAGKTFAENLTSAFTVDHVHQ